jgi:predicted FMN-binding regulatory protein PaiB
MDTARGKATSQLEDDVMILFNSPVHHYVTPKFYTETKPTTGKVVPTWNYAAVQAYGKAILYFDSQSVETTAFLTKQIDDLSHQSETEIMGYTSPWTTGESPASYVELLKKAIIGISVKITKLEGKFKMSQELKEGDREGAIKGFQNLGTPTGRDMAVLIEERGNGSHITRAGR